MKFEIRYIKFTRSLQIIEADEITCLAKEGIVFLTRKLPQGEVSLLSGDVVDTIVFASSLHNCSVTLMQDEEKGENGEKNQSPG